MKRKITTVLLITFLTLAILPFNALAADVTISSGGTYEIDTLYGSSSTITIATNDQVTLTQSDSSTALTNFCIVYSIGSADLTISGINIDNSSYDGICALEFTGTGNTLTVSGTNILKSGVNEAGIKAENTTELLINGDASSQLFVTSKNYGAGIGGSSGDSGGAITINSGYVEVSAGSYTAAIGGGHSGDGGMITINGGEVIASSGDYGAAIGGGSGGDGGTILITDGAVTASSQNHGAGIGGGSGGSGGSITIEGGTVTTSTWNSSAAIGGGTEGSGGTITIKGGSITANGGGNAAGIGGGSGGGCGTIVISGGTVDATGGKRGSGIGSGYQTAADDGSITITGGIITAMAKDNDNTYAGSNAGAGIGSGQESASVSISISGAATEVTAYGGDGYDGGGAGIGGGYQSDGGIITISQGNVTAEGGNTAAGIGSGSGGSGGTILISGGTINASTGGYAAAIGGGHSGDGGNITINDGIVNATSGNYGSAIGGGFSGNGGNIAITGGEVNATSLSHGAGIGGGATGDGGTILISGGTITASSYDYSAAIGGGSSGSAGSITIEGGRVTASSFNFSSAIGGGSSGDGGTITISGGEIYADSGISTINDIGNGSGGTEGTIEISNDAAVFLRYGNISPVPTTTHNLMNDEDLSGTTAYGYTLPASWMGSDTAYAYISSILVIDDDYITNNGNSLDLNSLENDYKFTVQIATTQYFAIYQTDAAALNYMQIVGTIPGVNLVIDDLNLDLSAHELLHSLYFTGVGNELDILGSNTIVSSDETAGITVNEGTELTISGRGSLNVTGFSKGAGIGGDYGENSGTIHINSGNVTAISLDTGAAIGGGQNCNNGIINISGGTVSASANGPASGIGGGYQGNGGEINISGGTITAQGGNAAAGIGGGAYGNAETITITGGRVEAAGGYFSSTLYGAAIGGGDNGNGGTITISGGEVYADSGNAAAYDIGRGESGVDGTIEISGDAVVFLRYGSTSPIPTTTHNLVDNQDLSGTTAYRYTLPTSWQGSSDTAYAYLGNSLIVDDDYINIYGNFLDLDTLPTSYEYNVYIDTTQAFTLLQYGSTTLEFMQIECITSGVNLTIEDLNIDLSAHELLHSLYFTGAGNSLTISGSNTIVSGDETAGITVNEGTELTISGTGSLDVTGSAKGAGIGGDYGENSGTIHINSGNITAVGLDSGAAIGGGQNCNNGIINIYGGSISASADGPASGIGGGYQGNGGEINISGGTITAQGGNAAAGIGGGAYGNAETITITGGRVEATGGYFASTLYGAAIGGGDNGNGGAITISGGEVYADSENVTAYDIGRGESGVDGTFEITENAVVFLRYGSTSPTPTAASHSYLDYEDLSGTTAYGYTLPASWQGSGDTAYAYDHAVTGVSLDIASATLILDDGNVVNDSVQLTETVNPSYANQNVTWSTSDSAVATVDSTGLVTALSSGSATITVTTDDGGHIDTCSITVEQRATGVTLDITSATLILDDGDVTNDTVQLTETVSPDSADNKDATWSTSNSAVATVDTNGLVTAVSAGSATITVTTDDVGHTATCSITVEQSTTGVVLDITSATLILDDGNASNDTIQLIETVSPNYANNKNVSWSTSNSAVATVNDTGLVTAVSAGSATITVTTDNMGYTATCSITVEQRTTSVSLNVNQVTLVLGDGDTTNDTLNLIATVEPSDAGNKTIEWESNNPTVATVVVIDDSTCQVVAHAVGEATITVHTDDGEYTDTCKIEVIDMTEYPGSRSAGLGGTLYDLSGDPKEGTKVKLYSIPVADTTDINGDFSFGTAEYSHHTLVLHNSEGVEFDRYTIDFVNGSDTGYSITGNAILITYTNYTTHVELILEGDDITSNLLDVRFTEVYEIINPQTGDTSMYIDKIMRYALLGLLIILIILMGIVLTKYAKFKNAVDG